MALSSSGCRVTPVSDTMPEQFTLSLVTSTTTQQFTYFHLDADDTLHFAGGRDAFMRNGKPLLKITAAQRQALWDLIIKHNLHNADGEFFPSAERVKYEFTLGGGGVLSLDRKYSAADGDVPGLADLQQHLMALRSSVKLDSPLPGPD